MKRIILGVLIMAGLFGMFGCDNKDTKNTDFIKDNQLSYFRYSSGGDMRGSHHIIEIEPVDENTAVITKSDKSWHGEDAKIIEYKVSIDVLNDIEKIFRDNNMETWNNKKFTDIFVADGASYSYSFYFGTGLNSVSFSSQIFEDPYRDILNEIHDAISKYLDTDKSLPRLVRSELSEEEQFKSTIATDGIVKFDVYEYSQKRLYFRIINGLEDKITISAKYMLYKDGIDEPIYDGSENVYEENITPKYCYENSIKLKERLDEGTYILKVDDYKCEFEIK